MGSLPRSLLLALLLPPVLSSLAGCYYLRVGMGQAGVLMGREPIEDVLASSALGPEAKAKLALVPRIRAFAQETVGLAKNGSYTKFYDTGEKPVSWNVTACEATAFRPYEWTFPFVGAAPYKGYFDPDDAREEAVRLREAGYDVQVYEVGAYSTLGWFDDPVFSRMLSRDVYDLANTIIHELTHATVFKSGDASFNESVAQFVGNEGALAFLGAHYGPGSKELARAKDAIEDEKAFTAYIDGLYERLDRLYSGGATPTQKRAGREKLFAESQREFEASRKGRFRDPDRWTWFARRKLDNAVILSFKRYHTDLDVYRDVLDLCGGDFRAAMRVYAEAAGTERPRESLRAWSMWIAFVRARSVRRAASGAGARSRRASRRRGARPCRAREPRP